MGSWCVCECERLSFNSSTPLGDHPLATHCEPSALYCWILRKDAGLCCGSRLRKGEVFAYVGRNQHLKDLKDQHRALCWSNGVTALTRSTGRAMKGPRPEWRFGPWSIKDRSPTVVSADQYFFSFFSDLNPALRLRNKSGPTLQRIELALK